MIELKEGDYALGSGPWKLLIRDATRIGGASATLDGPGEEISEEADAIPSAVVAVVMQANMWDIRLPADAAQALGEWASTAARGIALSLAKGGE